jgi:DNA replication protein DnaC
MQKVFDYCKEYAEEFDGQGFQSIYMFGETGLGKTHLSLAIAGKVIEKGYNVIYGSAHNFFNLIEREHFGRSENPDGTTEDKLLNCDLLILDDLGAEFITQFTVAELYNIIDTRLAKELPTIISSNIKENELEKKYNNRIASRILYSYYALPFEGNDIRQAISQED